MINCKLQAAYWMLTYILTNENVQKKVLAELNDVFKDFKGTVRNKQDITVCFCNGFALPTITKFKCF
jgi:hypothetical protein